jgi:hypothetical protein
VTRAGQIRSKRAPALGILLAFVLLLVADAAPAAARDLGESLAQAEADVATYQGELPTLQQEVGAAEAQFHAASQGAAPVLRTLRRRQADVRRIRREIVGREQRAEARIAAAEKRRQEEVDDHNEQVRSGVGFGLAALIAGLIALGWGWFRASTPVAALANLDLSHAVGLCVGGGLLTVVVGVVLGSSMGAAGALGSLILCLGLILPTALLLARHSAEVQRRRSKPLLRQERLPSWVPVAVAGLMLVIFLASTGSAVFAPGASSEPISMRLEEEAEGPAGERASQELQVAQEEVADAEQEATAPLARQDRAKQQLADARGSLRRVQSRLATAKSSQRSFSQRLVALEAKEQRQREKEEERLAREEQKRIEQQGHEEEEALAACDYNPCLAPASDYDCEGGSGDGPLYTGPVEVTGIDIYDLDRDNDGTGCEPE